jgi:hypothetical protein
VSLDDLLNKHREPAHVPGPAIEAPIKPVMKIDTTLLEQAVKDHKQKRQALRGHTVVFPFLPGGTMVIEQDHQHTFGTVRVLNTPYALENAADWFDRMAEKMRVQAAGLLDNQ